MATVVRRYARTHGPFPTGQTGRRFGVDPTPALRELERAGELVRGELLPGGSEREWCDADVLRRLRRASVAALRQEVEAVDQAELARFLPALAERRRPPARRRRPGPPARGAGPAPGRRADARGLGAATCCRAASAPTAWRGSTSSPPAASSSGSAPGALGRTGKVALYFREDVRLCRPAAVEREARPARRAKSTTRSASGSPAHPRSGSTWSPTLELRPRGDPLRALGPGLGRRGHQRRVRAAARPRA